MHENEGVVSEGVLHTPGGNSDDSDNDDDNEATTEQQVQEALLNVPFLCDVEVEPSACDTNEDELVTNFVATGCSCTKRCSSQFSKDHIQSNRKATLFGEGHQVGRSHTFAVVAIIKLPILAATIQVG